MSTLPTFAERCVLREGTKRFKAIRKRRVGVKRLRTVERMLKLRGKIVPPKLFGARYRAAGALRSLGLMMRRVDTQRREENELPLRDALLNYTTTEIDTARDAFTLARKIEDDGSTATYNQFAMRAKTATRTIERCRGRTLTSSANTYAQRQMTRIRQESNEKNRGFAYDRLHSIRKRIKHCMYIAQMLDDKQLRTRSAKINGMLGERNDRSEFAEFVVKASQTHPSLSVYGSSLRATCEQEADEIFTHLQEYVRM